MFLHYSDECLSKTCISEKTAYDQKKDKITANMWCQGPKLYETY